MENNLVPEAERKELWLDALAKFIVEANLKTWAADAGKLPDEDGFKVHEYAPGGYWRLKDKYSGYFRAPGFTTVFYKDKPVWMMTYGGMGQDEDSQEIVKETFAFLKKALMQVTPDLPFRGPSRYSEGQWEYTFEFYDPDGPSTNIADFLAIESIYYGRNPMATNPVFEQIIMGGIIVNKDENRNPIYPWNL